jgi:GT2 family glycosyltransferase
MVSPQDCVGCCQWLCPIDKKHPPCQKFDPTWIADEIQNVFRWKGKVSAVIPVYKGHARVLESVEAALKQVDQVVVTVDGPSLPGIKFPPRVKVIYHKGSRSGYGKNVMRGARHADGEFLLLLNDDCVIDPGFVEQLKSEMSEKVAIVGGQMRLPDGSLEHSANIISESYVEFVTFACALVRREILFKLKGFDERYDCYFEDVDFCFKVIESGLEVKHNPKATAVHYQSMSTAPMKDTLFRASREFFLKKWKNWGKNK